MLTNPNPLGQKTMAASNAVVVASDQSAIPVTGTVAVTGVATEATLAALSAKVPATLGQKAMAASLAVALASDQSALPVIVDKSATGTLSTVASAAVDTSILASNANRVGAFVFNESTAILYLGMSATAASLTAYTVQIPPGGFWEMPITYTGAIRGIWSAANGNARVTEMT